MNRLFAILCAAVLTTACSGGFESEVRAAVERQMAEYPESTLQDIYKSFFQDAFGVGHILGDRADVVAYIEREVQQVEPASTVVVEPTGAEGRFVRVELSAVKNGLLTAEELADAMAESADFETPTPEQWRRTWQRIERTIDRMRLDLPDYEADRKELASRLEQGLYVCHHSARYNAAYSRHYRIVRRDVFDCRFPSL